MKKKKAKEVWWCVKDYVGNLDFSSVSQSPDDAIASFVDTMNSALTTDSDINWHYFEKAGYRVVKIEVREI